MSPTLDRCESELLQALKTANSNPIQFKHGSQSHIYAAAKTKTPYLETEANNRHGDLYSEDGATEISLKNASSLNSVNLRSEQDSRRSGNSRKQAEQLEIDLLKKLLAQQIKREKRRSSSNNAQKTYSNSKRQAQRKSTVAPEVSNHHSVTLDPEKSHSSGKKELVALTKKKNSSKGKPSEQQKIDVPYITNIVLEKQKQLVIEGDKRNEIIDAKVVAFRAKKN